MSARLAFALLVCVGLCSCVGTSVKPWRRERLAHRCMTAEPDPEGAAFRAHVAGAREAALDPNVSGGGGCGCN